jgi:tetratricopeptide (TPR) repeat protein
MLLSWRSLLLCFVTSLSVGLPYARVARAEDVAAAESSDYRRWIDDAVSEYGLGNYEEAHALFAKAHAAFPTARTHRGLGMTAFELRSYVESIEHLEAALRATERPLEGELRTATEELLARAELYVGRVSLVLEPARAEVRLDRAGIATPRDQPLRLRVGRHELEVRADGYEPDRRTLSVASGSEQRVEVTLRKLPSAEPLLAAAAPARRDEGRRRWYKSPWLWSAVAAVGAVAVTSTVLLSRPERRSEPHGGIMTFGGP